MSGATTWVASSLLKTPAFLSDTDARRSAGDQEDLKPYWKSYKSNIFRGNQ